MIKIKNLISANGGKETHAIISVSDPMLPFSLQLAEIVSDYNALVSGFSSKMKPVLCRWFLSDAANQAPLLPKFANCAISVVEQPPLSLTKIALWVWALECDEVSSMADGTLVLKSNGYTHILEAGRCCPGVDSKESTYRMLSATESRLHDFDGSLLNNCVRTWFFVQNVDVNYAGVVEGRNNAFKELGLTRATRFIASTGIGGRHSDRNVRVQMDSYSVVGLHPGQMCRINAPEYLNPTYEYGVAFERATSIDYGDRRHLFISGTASIDNKGKIVWEGNVCRQTQRMWTNVEALLKAAECSWSNVGEILVYLRDPADYAVVDEMFGNRFPEIPYIILLAPVCRPGWLIEMECMAMKAVATEFSPF